MNLRKLNSLLKPYKMKVVSGSCKVEIIDDYESNECAIYFCKDPSHTCCGTEEFGEIGFSNLWGNLPQKIANEVVRHSLQESSKFQIIYSLEKDDSWNKFNEALSATGWIPLKRWKGNGQNMIQAWCR